MASSGSRGINQLSIRQLGRFQENCLNHFRLQHGSVLLPFRGKQHAICLL